MSKEQDIINNFIDEYKLDSSQSELVQKFIKYYKSKITKGAKRKYATPEEAYQAKLARNKEYRNKNKEQLKTKRKLKNINEND